MQRCHFASRHPLKIANSLTKATQWKGDRFAIKVLSKAEMVRRKQVKNVLVERSIMASTSSSTGDDDDELSHAAGASGGFVVPLLYSFQSERALFLVMEYMPGGDLGALVTNLGCLEEGVARQYIAEILLALRFMHTRGCVHRDLKPENVLIGRDGHVKLTDFGLSEDKHHDLHNREASPSPPATSRSLSPSKVKSMDSRSLLRIASDESGKSIVALSSFDHGAQLQGGAGVSPRFQGEVVGAVVRTAASSAAKDQDFSSTKVDEPGVEGLEAEIKRMQDRISHGNKIVGTPDYIAPEMLLGNPHGKAVDYWALGVILFELTTGCPPFNAETQDMIFVNILRGIDHEDVAARLCVYEA